MQIDGESAFMISKPLQLMIALFIRSHLKTGARPHFLITNNFAGAKGVVDRLSNETQFDLQPHLFETQTQAYAYLSAKPHNHVFIDSDVGFRKAISLLRLRMEHPKTLIYVFEEGVGTYRDDLYRGLKAKLFSLMGIATRFGASPMTHRILVLDSKEYRQKFQRLAHKMIGFEGNFRLFLSRERQALGRVFSLSELLAPEGPPRNECTLYLSNWTLDKKLLERLMTIPGDIYIKVHPHLQSKIGKDFSSKRVAWINPGIPAELAILSLLDRYRNVTVLDHGSSVRRYANFPRVNFIDIDKHFLASPPHRTVLL